MRPLSLIPPVADLKALTSSVLDSGHRTEPAPVGSSDQVSLMNLHRLMALTVGRPEVAVGLLDGPVATHHPDLITANITSLAGAAAAVGASHGAAREHGTFVAGVLSARRASVAQGVCPGCTLLVRPIFGDAAEGDVGLAATLSELADGIVQSVDVGADVLNVSAAVVGRGERSDQRLNQALDYAMQRGSLIVAAAGNQGLVASTLITRHPWVIPVVGFGLDGRPLAMSNLAGSLGKRGVGAPGERVVSLSPGGGSASWTGTSAATPLVTGALALLRSLLPGVPPAALRWAVNAAAGRRRTLVPPLLDAWAAYRLLH
jgi:subtilisin family serine protease